MNSRQYTPAEYQTQLAEKIAIFKHDFSEFVLPEPELFESTEKHFRMRAEFRIWHKGPTSTYCMFTDDEFKRAYDITEFPIGSELMNQLMSDLMIEIMPMKCCAPNFFRLIF